MWRYIRARVLGAIPILLGMSLIVFLFLYLIPGDTARLVAGPSADRATVESIRTEMGLDAPWYTQYLRFFSRAIRGDLGTSFQSRKPVVQEIGVVLKRTLQLTVVVQLLSFFIGGTLGILSALWRKSVLDKVVMAFSVLGLSLPQFWSALLFQMFFCARLGLLPPSGYQMGWDIYIVLPALTLTWPSAGLMARITRVAVVDVVGQDYVRTARAKGINPLKIAVKHIARNALIPMVTLVGTDISRMIGGMIMIEVIFTWPGMGKYVYDALIAKDFPAFQASTLVIAALIIGINILVDITYGLIDPRISYE